MDTHINKHCYLIHLREIFNFVKHKKREIAPKKKREIINCRPKGMFSPCN